MHNTRYWPPFLIALWLLPSVGFGQAAIRWEPTLENARQLAGQSNRLVLIYFSAPWCGVCKRMEAEVLTQPSVVNEISAKYVPVQINADYFPSTAKQYGVTALPTTVIVSPQGRLIASMQGRVEASEYASRLGRIVADSQQRGSPLYAQVSNGVTPPVSAAQPGGRMPQAVAGPAMSNSVAPQQPAMAGQPAAAASAAPGEDRYADFFRRNQRQDAASTAPIAQPSVAQTPNGVVPSAASGVAQINPYAVLSAMPTAGAAVPATPSAAYAAQPPSQPVQQPSMAQPGMAQPGNPTQASSMANRNQPPVSPNPQFGLDGYCAVSLSEKQQWVPGDRRWGAVHRGRTYLFAGPEEQRRFFADPDRYAPAVSGNDVVLATEQGQPVSGMREHGVFFGNRIYLFSSEATLQKFARNPNQYVGQTMGAVRPGAPNGQTF